VTISPPLDLDEVAALQTVVAGVRVLVVDDDARLRKAITRSLSRAAFHVLGAEDGVPAIALAETTAPDLALVDLHMPTPGTEVVRRLRELYGPGIWIAILSGPLDDATRAACFRAGADDVLTKPIPMVELQQRLHAASRSQQAYVEARLAAERLDRRLAYGTEAAAMLAHDLNNGLAVALSNIEFVRESDVLGGDEADALQSTLAALRRMSGLVSNFVDIARFEDAAVQPNCALVDVAPTLRAVVDVHRAGIAPTVELSLQCAPELRGYFDAPLVQRVLHNVVGNATRYCKNGTIRLSARASDPLDPTAVEIEVFNSGAPVPVEARSQLFLKYGKGPGRKRGLGLYFSRLACEAHGGSIEYRDVPAGAAFVIQLPGRH
jgi:signal transduction histidine kinase